MQASCTAEQLARLFGNAYDAVTVAGDVMRELIRSAWPIAAAVVIPVALFVIVQTGYSAREQRRMTEMKALAKSESIIASSDAILSRSIGALEALSTIQALPKGDIPGAYLRASQIKAFHPEWVTVTLTQASDGTELFDLRRPLGVGKLAEHPAPVPKGTLVDRIVREGRGCPCVLLEHSAPGPSGGYVVAVMLSTAPFERLLPRRDDVYEVSGIVTEDGRFIARSLSQAERVGNPGSPFLRAAVASGRPGGIYRGTTLEGFESYSAFARSSLTGWSAHIALGTQFLDGPTRVAFSSLGLAALLSLALAAILVWLAFRRMVEVRRAAERGQQAQKVEALGQLTGGIAHDFNNLLTPIIGALDFLIDRASLDERAKRIANGALASAQRAGKLTAQLLAFSRRQKLEIVPVDVPLLIEEMQPLLEQSVGNDHDVEVALAPDALCVKSDINQLGLALLNLVINARDAMPDGGTIRVESAAAREDGHDIVQIRVTDSGEGMSDEVKRRAAEPFYTTKDLGRGSGLGLAQVFAVMQQSGGSVDIDSRVGRGTTVTMRMPACYETPAPRPRSVAGGLSDSSRPLRLLLVDDDAAVRASIARLFEDEGHIVDSVGDARIALTAIEHCRYDLAIVDFAMPLMDGAKLIREARTLNPDQKFLMVTGYSDSKAVADACPNTPIIRKPFDGQALRALVVELTSD
jgi:signal transduction histidine kinase